MNVFEIDLGAGVVLVADGDGGAADVLETRVLDPQLFVVMRIDVDGLRHIAETVVVEGEASFVLADGGLALSFKGGIEQRELPAGRRLDGHDAVVAAVEMEIFGFVADVLERGKAGLDMEVHVGEEAVLRNVEADGDRGGVAVAEVEIDVAHGGVEGAGVGIDNFVGKRHRAFKGRAERHWWASASASGGLRGVHR